MPADFVPILSSGHRERIEVYIKCGQTVEQYQLRSHHHRHQTVQISKQLTIMNSMAVRCFTIFIIAVVVVSLLQSVEGTYRKPPFNGSIFGKRGATSIDYDNGAGKALSSMCEIASEACQAWFPSQEK